MTIAVPVLKRPCSSATLHLAACLRFAAKACACAACRGAAAPPHVQVKPGPEGYRQFTEAIRRAFNLPDDSELNITFTCDEPTTGSAGAVAAWGIRAAGAATAAVSARRRGVEPAEPAPLLAPDLHAMCADRAPALTAPAPPRLPVPAAVDNGSLLTLQGSGAYDAAVHCASVSAARRLTSPAVSRTVSTTEGAPRAEPAWRLAWGLLQRACVPCLCFLGRGVRRLTRLC